MNPKVYIHELVDITGRHRADYLHHVTANWSPVGQDERGQRCFGVWGTVGSTGAWPQVVNLWEEDGFTGLAASFGHELSSPELQDPKLAKWWDDAESFRRGGRDRICVPAPWSPTIEELCAEGPVGAAVYAHETVRVEPGGADAFLDRVRDVGVPTLAGSGVRCVAALKRALHDDSECILVWAFPTWERWGAFEQGVYGDPGLRGWRDELWARRGFERFLLCDAPLSPLRTGRQPRREDRTGGWSET